MTKATGWGWLFSPDAYDFKSESWYPEAIKAGKPIWSSVYAWEINPFPLAIAYASPIYDAQGNLGGRNWGLNNCFYKLVNFLRSFEVSPNSRTFIIERDGMLVANSGQQQPFKVVNNLPVRLNVSDSEQPVFESSR